ncbi:uncharacterized protein LOC123291004 isoform X2 [Chrysoperla carnea]|uniref:uncharacterized protein LOC123291004 isoform X2 n=1 Tax=Chrysoperla carnea TaxID=189513 RepID=UPI001D05DF65|nr:uncharacterized protein LOC123291004 isoform X2 [Chrysoperla carnea]
MKKIILKRSYKEAGLPLHYSLSPSTSTEHENSANRIDEDSHPSCVSISPSEEEESNDWIAVTCFNNRVFAGRLENKENNIWRWKWIILNNKIKEVLVYMNGEAREHLYISNYWRLKWFGGWANEVTIKEMVRIVKTILAYEEVGAIYVEEEVERNLFQKLFKMVDVITAWD